MSFHDQSIADDLDSLQASARVPLPPTTRRDGELCRVLHVINGEHYSGAERVQDLLALCLPRYGFQVGFACLKSGRFARLRQCQDAPLVEVPMTAKTDLGVAKRLAELVKQERYQLVHAHTPRSCMVARIVAGMAKVPLVYHVHSPAVQDSSRSWTNRINGWVERVSLMGVSQMITVSESLAEHMRSLGFNSQRISVVPNGVPRRDDLPVREPPNERWVLGTVALFRPRKGIEVLIDAVASLRGYGYDVRLRGVGAFETANYESAIKRQVAKQGIEDAVEWTGFTQHVDAEFDKMNLLVLPSLFGEGLPMVVLEAMAAGVPVVATRVEGVPEVIQDGRSGVIAAAGCAQDLSRCIRRVIRCEVSWSELRVNAYQRQRECFSDESMAAGVADVYRRIRRGANV